MNPMGLLNMVQNTLMKGASSNPMMKNVFDMVRRNDAKGIEEFARNLAKSKGIDPDEAIQQVRKQMGIFES